MNPSPLPLRQRENDQIFECCENNTYCAKFGKAGIICVRWFPIVFVFVLLVNSIYFFSVRLCIDHLIYGNIPRVTQGALYICAYWILFLFVTYSFIRAAFGDPRSPDQFNIKITVTQAEEMAAFTDDQYKELKKDQIVYLPRSTARMCGICNAPKPPRTHHCSTCQRCFLKMDHHCVWLDNCVGYGNYKFFFCLLFWATFMCGFVFGATLEVLIQQLVYNDLEGVSVVWLILTILSFALGLSTFMLLVYHSFLISKGMTTIEHIEISEEREDFKRRERIRRRERELENNNLRILADNPIVSNDNNKNPDDAYSTTNLLTSTSNNTTTISSRQVEIETVQLTSQRPIQQINSSTNPKFMYQNYSEGFYRNWCAALGRNPLLWLIPVNLPAGNGIRFKKEEATAARRICI